MIVASSQSRPGHDIVPVDERSRPVRPAGWEWGLLGVLCLGCLLFWAAHYHQFLVVASDYGQIERTAKEIWAGDLPSGYKRMPGYPILIGLVAKFMSGQRPELEAALCLNIAFSIGILILLFVFARRLIGVAAFIPVMVLPAMRVFNQSAVRPLIEPYLAFFILLTFLLFSVRSRWQYLAAFAAAIGRYEAAALIAIIFVLNCVMDRKFWRHVMLSALASTGFLTWMLLSALHSRSGNPYFEFLGQTGFNPVWSVPLEILRESYRGVYKALGSGNGIFDVAATLLLMIGIVISFRRFKIQSIALLSFLLLYTAIHVAYGVYVSRFAHTVSWIPLLYETVGAGALLAVVWNGVTTGRRASVGYGALTIAAAGTVWVFWKWKLVNRLVNIDARVIDPGVYLGFFVFLLGLGMVFAIGLMRRRGMAASLVLGCSLVMFFGLYAAHELRGFASDARKIYYNKYETYLAGQWLEENMKPDEKAVLFLPGQVGNPNHFAKGQLIGWRSFRAETHEELLEELDRRGVTYVTYTYRRGKPADPDAPRYAYYMYYYTRYKVYLAEPFMGGEDLPGFEHLETIALPEWMQYPPTQIYRFLGDSGARSGGTSDSS